MGNYVYILHTYLGTSFVSRYGHMTSVNVSMGDPVTKDTVIGTVGTTGSSTGNHLDFTIYHGSSTSIGDKASTVVDPFKDQFLEMPANFYTTSGSPCCKRYVNEIISLYSTPIAPDYSVTNYSATFELVCASKPEHETPYGDSEITKTYSKGDLIPVVGYTYNSYGNLWYKTAAGGFIYYEFLKLDTMVQQLPPSNYIEATMIVKTPEGSGKWVKDHPSSSGEYLKKYERNETIKITHYLYNSVGNLWYETSEGDGHYVFYSYLDVQSPGGWIPSDYVESSVEIESTGIPVRNIIQAEGSTIVETLNSGNVKKVVGYVYNRYGNLWYVLGEDRVVFFDYCKNVGSNDLPGNYVGQKLVVSQNTRLYDGNYWGTVTDDTAPMGTVVNAIAYVTNKYGSIYYEISGGKYIPKEYLIPYYYRINFDANGGTGTMQSISVTYEEVFSLPACTFERAGYEFKGWNAQRECDGKWYVSGKGWNSETAIIENNYTKNVYADEWEGYLNNSWANNITEADEYTLYAVWEQTAHTHSYTPTVTAPTCTEKGYTTYICACGDSYKGNYIAALGHNYTYKVATTPTTSASGVLTGTCSRCSATTMVTLPKLNATDYTYAVTKPATCTATGTGRYTWKTTTYGTFYFDVTIAKIEHSYSATVTAPTCTEKGYTTYTCACGDSYVTDYVGALGHNFVGGVCTRCGEDDPNYNPPTPKDPCEGYTDINRNGWYHSAADFVIERGLMGSTRTDALTFEPNTPCTRSMIVMILYNIAGTPDVSYVAKFPDVKDGQWYTKAVMWAYQNGIVSGYDNGKFGPNDKVTREQMAVVLKGYADFIGKDTSKTADLSKFPDGNKATWSKSYISWAVAEGLINGKAQNGKTYLDPQGVATRAEVAALIRSFVLNILEAK